MIEDYRDHAANERTFLAWVRTGIAVIAFGLLIERFNLFVMTLASSSVDAQLRTLSQRVGRYEGFMFILAGLAIVVLATVRFTRTTRLLDAPQTHPAKSVRAELVLSAALVLLVASYGTYLAFS
jgi:putative membrane protein